MKRKRLTRRQSASTFRHGARVTDSKNITGRPMRGGIRL